MNDGVKILLERMQTHPEEFYGHYNRWTEVINNFEKYFNTSERALVNGALTNLRREEFTRVVLQEILREPTPVEIDPNTYTIKTAGRDPWGSTTLEIQERTIRAQKNAMLAEIKKVREEHQLAAAEAFKKEIK
jgi:hypothetical protein